MSDDEPRTEDLERWRAMIPGKLRDLAIDFIYYGRKDDWDLPVGSIELLIQRGLLTPDELVALFKGHLFGMLGVEDARAPGA